MGIFYWVTCRNKACRYSVRMREGPGMRMFANTKQLERDIGNGIADAPEDVRRLIDSGYKLDCVTNYLCPVCREWVTDFSPFIFEPVIVSPYGTVREYRMHYVYGAPKCKCCGTELVHILNPRSSKNKCPKCGCHTMQSRECGYID